MAINFIQGNPAISAFDAGMDRADRTRRQETEDFRSRLQFENAQGADRAMRTGIGAYYAEPGAGPTAAPPAAVPPTQAQPPAVARPVAAPPMPAAQPPAMGAAGMEAPNAGEAQAQANARTVAAPPVPQPTTVTAMPPRSAAVSDPRSMASSKFAPIMRNLAAQPGTGQAMMSMFGHDLQTQQQAAVMQRQQEHDGIMLMSNSLAKGDVRMARMAADRYGLSSGIPEEFWKSREAMSNFAIAGNLVQHLKLEPEQNLAFIQAYGKAAAGGMPPEQAQNVAMQAIGTVGGRVAGRYPGADGRPVLYDRHGRQVASNLPPMRAPYGGRDAAGHPTGTVQNRTNMEGYIKRAYPGIDDQTIAKLIVNPKSMMTPQDVMRVQTAMSKLKDALGDPVYKTPEALRSAVQSAIQGAKEMTARQLGAEGNAAAADPGSRPPLSSFQRGPASQAPDDTEEE